MRYCPCMLGMICGLVTFGGVVAGPVTSRPAHPEIGPFMVLTKAQWDYLTSKGWLHYHVMYLDREKLKQEWAVSRPAEGINVYQCLGGAQVQQETAREFGGLADVYSYDAFAFVSSEGPAEGETLWPGYDDPFINHARKMRNLVGSTPIMALLNGSMGLGTDTRQALPEEVQWQVFAALGADYRGVVWPGASLPVTWGEDCQRIGERIREYGPLLGAARPVDWAAAEAGQPVSAAACETKLFVFLLNPAYMTLDDDGQTVVAPLDKCRREGVVTLTLPPGVKVGRGQTLGGKALHITIEADRTAIAYSFAGGGDMLILSLSGYPRPASQPANTQSKVMETAR